MAPVLGIEPRTTESKSVVLPVTPHRIKIGSRSTTFTHPGLCWPRTGVGPRCFLLALEINLRVVQPSLYAPFTWIN